MITEVFLVTGKFVRYANVDQAGIKRHIFYLETFSTSTDSYDTQEVSAAVVDAIGAVNAMANEFVDALEAIEAVLDKVR